jgi:hypothetical protein
MSPPEFVSTEPGEVHLIDTSAASVPQLMVDSYAAAIHDAIKAIRETTSREQAIGLLEALLPAAPTAALIERHESARGLQIADEAMFNVLSSNCVPGDHHGSVMGLVDVSGSEVNKLGEADRQIVEAFDWLRLRGYVELAADGLGEHIIVIRRPSQQ